MQMLFSDPSSSVVAGSALVGIVMKPKMTLDNLNCGDGMELIERACSILIANRMEPEARAIEQIASIIGYDFYKCLRILKQFMSI